MTIDRQIDSYNKALPLAEKFLTEQKIPEELTLEYTLEYFKMTEEFSKEEAQGFLEDLSRRSKDI